MLDPIPPPPEWLQKLTQPLAEYLALPVLPLHIHEVLGAFVFYQIVQSVISPRLSAKFFPRFYPNFPARTRLNWDVHVVSLVQSTLINAAALWVMFVDEERKNMTSGERVYGYSGACSFIQALAVGYFLWDLIISTIHVKAFGIGLLFHAISALWVFSLGFRPFVTFYSPNFILYELSSPFLNFHWFFDKVNMTGSRAQWYNGMILLSVFFCCRLVWGTWQSVLVFVDIFKAYGQSRGSASLLEPFDIHGMVFKERNSVLCVDEACAKANAQITSFANSSADGVPFWLVLTYLSSNLILNSLNFYWFSKMIETVLKRFRAPVAGKEKDEGGPEIQKRPEGDVVLDAAAQLEEDESIFIDGGASHGEPKIVTGRDTNGGVRSRKA